MSDLQVLWQRIARWHQDHIPKHLRRDGLKRQLLNPGASSEDVEAVQQALGLPLPADIRESYQLHDGSHDDYPIFPEGYSLMPLAKVVQSWRELQELAIEDAWDTIPSDPLGPIRPIHWHSRWVPITDNGGGDYQCVDLDPAPGGVVGQIIDFSHETGPALVAASSFGAWLRAYADDLEAGRYRYHPDAFWIDPIGRP